MPKNNPDNAIKAIQGGFKEGRRQFDLKGSVLKQKETGRIAQQYLELLLNTSAKDEEGKFYCYETGMTPEKYLWLQLTSLLSKDRPVLMDYEPGNSRAVLMLDSMSVHDGDVYIPYFANVGDGSPLETGGIRADAVAENYGIRTVVDLT